MIDHLATERFGSEYLADRGIMRLTNGAMPLKAGVADIDAERLRDPHVAFLPPAIRGTSRATNWSA